MASGKSQEEILEEILSALTGGSGNSSPVGRKFTGGTDEASHKQMLADMKAQHDSFSKWNAVLKKGHLQYTDSTEQLKKFDEQIAATADAFDKQVLADRKAELEAKTRAANRNTAFYNSLSVLNKATGEILGLGKSAVLSAGNLTKSFLGGASGVQFSTELMTAGLDLAGDASKVAGNAVSGVGAAMAQGTGRIKLLGIAAEVAGTAIGMIGEGATKFLKFGVEVLSKEVEKTVTAFNTAANAGAMFANGMTGLRDASGAAGLTVDQFSKVLQQHSVDLAGAGLGVSEGARKVGGALSAGGTKMKQELLNLGYSFEEQAGLTAETISRMKGSGVGPMTASNKQVAEQTQKYADNLRIITAITGEDAKKKMEAVKDQANQLAFQQKIAGRSAVEQDNILQGMQNMSPVQRKNFMDMVNFGSVVNAEGAAFQAQSAGMNSAVNQSYNNFLSHSMDAESERANIAANGNRIQKDLLDNTALGLAGAANVGGIAQSLAESMGKELEFRKVWNIDSQANAIAGVEAQKTTKDSFTKMVTANEVVMQEFRTQVQTLLTGPMGKFADVMGQTLAALKKTMEEAGILVSDSSKKEKGFFEEHSKLLKIIGGTAMVAGGAALTAATFGGAAPIGAAVGMMGTGLIESGLTEKSQPGFSDGGVSAGPQSGHQELLHGTELIIPLTEQGTIKEGTRGHKDLINLTGPESSQRSMTVPASESAMSTDVTQGTFKDSALVDSLSTNISNLMTSMMQTQQEIATRPVPEQPAPQIIDRTPNFDAVTEALTKLISTSRDQLDKQDEMLRAMHDTKDYTERLYHAMS